MNYAIVVDGSVTNLIHLDNANACDFPNAVKTNSRPVDIGDTYDNGKFYHNGVEVSTDTEVIYSELVKASITAESLAERVVDLEIQLMEVT